MISRRESKPRRGKVRFVLKEGNKEYKRIECTKDDHGRRSCVFGRREKGAVIKKEYYHDEMHVNYKTGECRPKPGARAKRGNSPTVRACVYLKRSNKH